MKTKFIHPKVESRILQNETPSNRNRHNPFVVGISGMLSLNNLLASNYVPSYELRNLKSRF